MIDLDSLYQSADHLAAGAPVERAEARLQSCGEFLKTPNHENKIPLKLEFLSQRLLIILRSVTRCFRPQMRGSNSLRPMIPSA